MLSLIATQFASPVLAGSDAFMGEVYLVASNFCPDNSMRADGQILPINQNQALFALLGTQFGGNGSTTFALPDLRGRLPLHAGQGPGLPNYIIGQSDGLHETTLISSNLPAHTHNYNFVAKAGRGVQTSAAGAFIAQSGIFRDSGTNVNLATQTTDSTGAGTAFSNMPPYLGLTYCIVTEGIYPPRP